MSEKIIKFPRKLNNIYSSYVFFSDLQNELIDSEEQTIILDMSDCEYVHAIFTSYLGALLHIGHYFGKNIIYRTRRDTKLDKYLRDSGLVEHILTDFRCPKNKNAIPFKKITLEDDFIIDYIGNILDLAPIKLNPRAEEMLFQNIYEIFSNAVDHSRAKLGVYACGHWMPKGRYLSFSVYDTGIGIPALVKETTDNTLSSEDALLWALKSGHSTKQLIEGTPRGLGLTNLKKFIQLNDGALIIYANDIYYQYKGTELIRSIPNSTIGTLIGITIIADYNHIYTVKN